MVACWAHHEEGVEGTHIPFSLGGGSRAKTSGLESRLQDAPSDALLKGCCKEHLELTDSSKSQPKAVSFCTNYLFTGDSSLEHGIY